MIFWLDIWIFIFMILCLLLVGIFEFINWFHDTANAVAQVIYTKSLKAKNAVLIAWIMNFLWVVFWGIWVAMAIIHLLPLDAISFQSEVFGISVVISLLLSAIIWNFSTWYFGLPASSSHSLIWAILWVTIVMMFLPISWNVEVIPNWQKAIEVIESLLFSPFVWFLLASVIMFFSIRYIKNKYYFSAPLKKDNNVPTRWLRSILIATSAWVSFAHGSNDWQKWVWLAMLILVILAPNIFAINPEINITDLNKNITWIQKTLDSINLNILNEIEINNIYNTLVDLNSIREKINFTWSYDKKELRKNVLSFNNNIKKLDFILSNNSLASNLYIVSVVNSDNIIEKNLNKWDLTLNDNISWILKIIDYAPIWIVLFISFSLWLWTMIWRKRIVVTIWEKIWKTEMNYAQATTSAFITAITITIASRFHLPVSTTHILSSSVAWTMSVWPKSAGVRYWTVKNILLAWVLTLPVTMFLSGLIFFIMWIIFVK